MFSSSSRNHRLFITDEVVTFALKIIAFGRVGGGVRVWNALEVCGLWLNNSCKALKLTDVTVFRFQQIRCNMEFLETNLSFWKLIFLGVTGLKKNWRNILIYVIIVVMYHEILRTYIYATHPFRCSKSLPQKRPQHKALGNISKLGYWTTVYDVQNYLRFRLAVYLMKYCMPLIEVAWRQRFLKIV